MMLRAPVRPQWTALVAVLSVLASSCERAPANSAERLDASLNSAANEFHVPKAILAGIGYVETRWHLHAGTPSIDQGFGPMHLVDGDADSSLQRAAHLTGLSTTVLKTDLDANIRGGAAVLREMADKYFSSYTAKSDQDIAQWWQVVMHYSGVTDPEAADEFATEVYGVVLHGASAALEDLSVFKIQPTSADTSHEQIFAHSQHALSPDYPSAEWHPASSANYTAGRPARPSMVVIHTAQGSWTGTINWFANPAAQASAAYVVRSSDGLVASMVHDMDTAWHAGNWDINQKAVGIEHEGYVDQPGYLTDAMYQSSANLTRWLCDTYGIPKDRQHIIGHYEVPDPYHPGQYGGSGHHTDPCVTLDGSQCFWDWNKYMSLVNPQQPPPPQTGTLKGFVYSSEGGSMPAGNTHPLPGARVFIPETGATQIADGRGFWSFDLPPGNYSPSASMPGFMDGSPFLGAKRPVTAGAVTWGSFVLQKIQQTGTVSVFVYAVNPTNAGDQSTPVPGAQVSVGTTTCSAGDDGKCQLTVGEGMQQVQATKDGYDTGTVTANVPAGGNTSISIGLKSSTDAPPTIAITSPTDGAMITSSPLMLQGTATGLQVVVTVGGAAATLASDGTWSAAVTPMEGESSISAVATDLYGRQATATVKIVYDAHPSGVKGKVTDAISGQPIANALITSGEAMTQTATDGTYTLALATGMQSLAVQAMGYVNRTVTVTVPQMDQVQQDIELLPSTIGTLLTITSPKDGSTVSSSKVTVTGTVALAHVTSLTVNGVTAQVTNGSFTAHNIPLKAGKNTITAHAVTQSGLDASQAITVTGPKAGCGCSSGADLGWVALGALALGRVRRRSAVVPGA